MFLRIKFVSAYHDDVIYISNFDLSAGLHRGNGYVQIGRGGACSSREKIYITNKTTTYKSAGATFGRLRKCNEVIENIILWQAGGASPSPTEIDIFCFFVRYHNTQTNTNLFIKPRHRGIQKQILSAQTSTFARGGFPAR